MKAAALLIAAVWIAAGAGRRLTGRLTVLRAWPLERLVYAAAIGLGVAGYGVFALGLCGLLKLVPITLWWGLLALIGLPGMRANGGDLANAARNWRAQGRILFAPKNSGGARIGWLVVVIIGVLLGCGGIAFLACFSPPSGHEWDALAYHLADPKVFLQNGRIASLPTEHHSNFPFLMEMLFTVGLLYDGYALANLFHWTTGALTVLALLAYCRRTLDGRAGWLAALLFATTPLALWEAGVAYNDLGMGLYTTLAAFAALSAVNLRRAASKFEARRPLSGTGVEISTPVPERAPVPPPEEKSLSMEWEKAEPTRERAAIEWAMLAGVTMGFALGVKYLALLPFAFVGLALLVQRASWRTCAAYGGLALALAAPWYVKNLLLTSNPVYPYAYNVFPNSRYWSADRAAIYQTEQSGFGYAHAPKKPSEALRNLIEIPWRLVSRPALFMNRGNVTFSEQIGGLYAGLLLALAFLRPVPRVVRSLVGLSLAQGTAWFFVAQVGRYLVATLPLLAVAGGYAACLLSGWSEPGSSTSESLPNRRTGTWIGAAIVMLALGGQTILTLWSVIALPTGGRDANEAYQRGLMPASLSLSEALANAASAQARETGLNRHLDIYAAQEWINRNAPSGAGVLLLEETRGFYLDRPYLWGNREHSSYIPYALLADGAALTAWLRGQGIGYALINLKFSPQMGVDPELSSLAMGDDASEAQVMTRWYAETPYPAGSWRGLLAQAIRGGWTPVFARNGVVVLQIGSPSGQAEVPNQVEKRARIGMSARGIRP